MWAGSSSAITMENYFSSCSVNKVRLREEDTLVVGPIQVPCSGNTSWGGAWTASKCGENEIVGWAQYAEEVARTVRTDGGAREARGEDGWTPLHDSETASSHVGRTCFGRLHKDGRLLRPPLTTTPNTTTRHTHSPTAILRR